MERQRESHSVCLKCLGSEKTRAMLLVPHWLELVTWPYLKERRLEMWMKLWLPKNQGTFLMHLMNVPSVSQSCLILCDPMDCSPPGSSVHWISQARMLEWVAISYSRASSQLRDWTLISSVQFNVHMFSVLGNTHVLLDCCLLFIVLFLSGLLLEKCWKKRSFLMP